MISTLTKLIAKGESKTLRFKRSTGELREALQTLSAFANGKGGRVIIGVKPAGQFLDQRQLRGRAFKLLEEAEIFCQRHFPRPDKIVTSQLRCVERPLIPRDAMREILVNALIHRDYSIAGGAVSLAILDNRVEVWSAGRYPSGITPESRTRAHLSVQRNPIIAAVFYRTGRIERRGGGWGTAARVAPVSASLALRVLLSLAGGARSGRRGSPLPLGRGRLRGRSTQRSGCSKRCASQGQAPARWYSAMAKAPRKQASKEAAKKVSVGLRQSSSLLSSGKFDEVLALIEAARRRAYQAVNTELVTLYWQVGEYISKKIEHAEWGDGVVDELAFTITRQYPGMRGYTRRNLFRMRQFFETYRGLKKVSPLVTQLPWTHHLILLSQTKHPAEREFYMLAAIKGRWTKRELERQIQTGAALRSDVGSKKVAPTVTQTHPTAIEEFKNAYNFEFLALPDGHSEADLHGALLRNLGRFIMVPGTIEAPRSKRYAADEMAVCFELNDLGESLLVRVSAR